jgi:hypothetical protein
VADEEQPPAPRPLVAAELAVEIGDLRVVPLVGPARIAAPAVIGDGDDDLGARVEDLDVDGEVRTVVIAVLDGVHRRLGDRGFELLQPPGRQVQVRHAVGDLRERDALAARHAR